MAGGESITLDVVFGYFCGRGGRIQEGGLAKVWLEMGQMGSASALLIVNSAAGSSNSVKRSYIIA